MMVCLPPKADFFRLASRICHAAERVVGAPDYATYLAHMALHHAGETPMGAADFVRAREAARFGGNGSLRCC
jgi:uncharacterized short protein YbdD (DUF466 family)